MFTRIMTWDRLPENLEGKFTIYAKPHAIINFPLV